METKNKSTVWCSDIIIQAVKGSFTRLNPVSLLRNPVMLIVEIGSAIVTVIAIKNIFEGKPFGFNLQISLWLWVTVLFSNFAEALAEGKGKAQAETLRKTRSEAFANKILPDGKTENVPAMSLRKGDSVIANDNEIIACDGEIIEGVALIDESAITGQ